MTLQHASWRLCCVSLWCCLFHSVRGSAGERNTACQRTNKYTCTHQICKYKHMHAQIIFSITKKFKTQTKKDTESGGNTYISFVGPQACWAPASAETNTVAIIERTNIIKNVEKLLVQPILPLLKNKNMVLMAVNGAIVTLCFSGST